MNRGDVAVVGAGPAGAWTAFALACAGARVTVFDASHPREKPCGGGLTGRALDVVSGVVTPSALNGAVVTAARFDMGGPDDRPAIVPLPPPCAAGSPALVIVNRKTLDGALLDAALRAGATWVPARVREVEVGSTAVRLRTSAGSFDASFLVGADGATSLIRRRTCGPFQRCDVSMAAGFFVDGPTSPEVRIRWCETPPGYLWAFPRSDGLAAGMGAPSQAATTAALRATVALWLGEVGVRPSTALRPYAWPIPSLTRAALARERPAGERWLLVGDAAGLVDPLTREGIYYALKSAELAAAALAGASSPQHAYLGALRRTIYPELDRAARYKPGFFTTGFARLLGEALATSASVREVMVDLIAGRQPYRGLRSRLLRTGEVGLAWRLLKPVVLQ